MARAINAASGNRPLVVLANLSGFDGSPESMRRWQLEYGAEIGRAVTNFRGPIVFVVVSRYHGGAFVVFSKKLNERMEIAAVEGSYASVIGGAPAAATVFAREVDVPHRAGPARARGGRRRCTPPRDRCRQRRGPGSRKSRPRFGRRSSARSPTSSTGSTPSSGRLRWARWTASSRAEALRPYIVDALDRGMVRGVAAGEARYVEVAAGASTSRDRPSATGGGPAASAATVSRNRPSRRHQPGKTVALDGPHRQAPQPSARGAAGVTSTLRVSRRSPVRSTFSALSFADQIRFAAASRSSPAARRRPDAARPR